MKSYAFIYLLAFTDPIFSSPIPASPSLELQDCNKYAPCRPSFETIARVWNSKNLPNTQVKDPKAGPISEPHFPAHQLAPTANSDHANSGHAEVAIVRKPVSDSFATNDRLDRNRLLPPPMAQKVSENSTPEPKRDPSLEAVFRGTHEDAAKSAQAAERTREQIWKQEALEKANAKVELESVAAKTDGTPFPTAVILREPKSTSSKCCIEDQHMNGIVVETKRFGLTNWIKSNCAMIKDGKTITYTYSYVKRDYTDVLVVGLVMVFLIAVVVIELLQTIFNPSRSLLGRGIRLQDGQCDCECNHDNLPPYTPRESPAHFAYPNKHSPSMWEQWVDEKPSEVYVLEVPVL